ncbi:hypothetical protein [Lysobacter sp. CA199]|uniref:hypothetical protein n=1 Tax=Lysobacter sp. CA199 TaxID=3455608 RepID=UPI003F8D27BA
MAKTGRPTAFKSEFTAQATKLAAIGATDAEIADFFEVSVRTLYRWAQGDDEFRHALKLGKEPADDRVERALFERARGYAYTEQQAIKVKRVRYGKTGKRTSEIESVEVVEVRRQAPPDTVACIFWLKNRRRKDWRDKFDHAVRGRLEATGKVSVADLTEAELLAIAAGIDEAQAAQVEAGTDG